MKEACAMDRTQADDSVTDPVSEGSGSMSGAKVWLIGFGIFAYFTITTAWLPSKLLQGPLAGSSRFVQDLVTLIVWGFFLGAGILALRKAQKRGLI